MSEIGTVWVVMMAMTVTAKTLATMMWDLVPILSEQLVSTSLTMTGPLMKQM